MRKPVGQGARDCQPQLPGAWRSAGELGQGCLESWEQRFSEVASLTGLLVSAGCGCGPLLGVLAATPPVAFPQGCLGFLSAQQPWGIWTWGQSMSVHLTIQDGSSIAFYAQISIDIQNHFRRILLVTRCHRPAQLQGTESATPLLAAMMSQKSQGQARAPMPPHLLAVLREECVAISQARGSCRGCTICPK